KPDLRIALFYKYTGVLPGFYLNSNQEIVQSFINDFHMMDVTISKSFYKKRFNCSMGVKNLFDVRNINSMNVSSGAHSSGTGSMPLSTGRLFFAGIEFNFNSKR
ncbi:MAG TPA: outer membrane beta-barrel protein, partial [Flavobacteriales bacterium]|nr:outer membrane beta-barrel protein [Flavobacteriales bacterium]